MSKQNNYADDKGLSIGEEAPQFSITDIDGNQLDLSEILQNYRGLLIDFFRGVW
jgi:peroxiredoxin